MMCSRVRIRRMDMDMRMRGMAAGAVGRRAAREVRAAALGMAGAGSRGLVGLGGSCRR